MKRGSLRPRHPSKESSHPSTLTAGLYFATRGLDDLECAALAHTHSTRASSAALALAFADERLFTKEVAREARRVRAGSTEDEIVRSRLLARLGTLRRRLAGALLRAETKSGPVSTAAARLTASEDERTHSEADELARRAKKLVPDENPTRIAIGAEIARLQSSEPLTPSGLFVLIELLERLVPAD